MAKRSTRRNTKRRTTRATGSSGFTFPLPLATILLLAATLSLAYLWLNGRADAMGKRIQELEQRSQEVRNRMVNEQIKWSNITTLQNIQRELKRHAIDMRWPDENHVIRIYDQRPRSEGQQYARVAGTAMHD